MDKSRSPGAERVGSGFRCHNRATARTMGLVYGPEFSGAATEGPLTDSKPQWPTCALLVAKNARCGRATCLPNEKRKRVIGAARPATLTQQRESGAQVEITRQLLANLPRVPRQPTTYAWCPVATRQSRCCRWRRSGTEAVAADDQAVVYEVASGSWLGRKQHPDSSCRRRQGYGFRIVSTRHGRYGYVFPQNIRKRTPAVTPLLHKHFPAASRHPRRV